MTFIRTLRLAALSAALAVPLAPACLAQAQPPAAAPGIPKDAAAKVDQRIARLHDQLGITPAEQPQWDQFAQVMRDNANEMHQAFSDRSNVYASANAADNMQSYARMAQVHAANMQKLATAFSALYANFPDPQKQVADRVFKDKQDKQARHGHAAG